MAAGTIGATKTLDQIILSVGKLTPFGVTVTNKALTSNVATLTTGSAHGFAAADRILVAGVDSTFNGYYTVVSAPTTTTLTYAKTAANVGSTAVSPTGMVSERVGHGKRRMAEVENLENDLRAQTAETTGYFSAWIEEREAAAPGKTARLTIKAVLLLHTPKDISSDMNTAVEVAESVVKEMMRQSDFETAGALPESAVYTYVDEDGLSDSIMLFDVTGAYQIGGPC